MTHRKSLHPTRQTGSVWAHLHCATVIRFCWNPEVLPMKFEAPPAAQGLYDPRHEHDACGVGFVVDLKGRKSSSIVKNGLEILLNLEHRGASGCEENTGDGAGILIQVPHRFFVDVCPAARIKLPAAGQY